MNKRLILVTNDDGIYAPGIARLVAIAKEFGDVVVLAPDRPQSGMGHAITINSTLRINKSSVYDVMEEYSCSGTPVDCVKLAINKILPRKPDLVLSGINHGANMSINVIYSGTMSAALEGAIEGVPSIGFSLCDHSIDANFDAAESVVRKVINESFNKGIEKGVCLNVNIPPVSSNELKGIKVCRQTKANWVEELDERKDPGGNAYYWLTGKFVNFEEGNEETDVWAINNNYVSVVPVQFDLTAYNALPNLKTWTFE